MEEKSKSDLDSKEKTIPIKYNLDSEKRWKYWLFNRKKGNEDNRNSPVERHETVRSCIYCTVFNIIFMVLFVILIIVGRYSPECDTLQYQKSYHSTKDLKRPVFGYRSIKSEDLIMSLTEKAHKEDYYETTESGKTILPYDESDDYKSQQQTEGKVTYFDPDMFFNLLFDIIKKKQIRQAQDVHHAINDDNYFRYGIMFKRKHWDGQEVDDYKKSEDDVVNSLLGRNTNVPNRRLEKQSESERQRDGNDNVIIYEPISNNHKFMKHILDRYVYMQNMFLMKQIKRDGNVQPRASDSNRNNNKVTNMLFDGSANNMPQAFQIKQLNFIKARFLNSGEQKSKINAILVNYHDKNETNKNENIIDRNENNISESKKNEDKENISIDEKKEILSNNEKIRDRENISDDEKKDNFLNTEVENESSESSRF